MADEGISHGVEDFEASLCFVEQSHATGECQMRGHTGYGSDDAEYDRLFMDVISGYERADQCYSVAGSVRGQETNMLTE